MASFNYFSVEVIKSIKQFEKNDLKKVTSSPSQCKDVKIPASILFHSSVKIGLLCHPFGGNVYPQYEDVL